MATMLGALVAGQVKKDRFFCGFPYPLGSQILLHMESQSRPVIGFPTGRGFKFDSEGRPEAYNGAQG